jgi:hypothetical protein
MPSPEQVRGDPASIAALQWFASQILNNTTSAMQDIHR